MIGTVATIGAVGAAVLFGAGIVLARIWAPRVPREKVRWRDDVVGMLVVADTFPREYLTALELAIGDWEQIGVRVRRAPRSSDSPYDASNEPVRGTVVFDRRFQAHGEHLGETRTHVDRETGFVVSAGVTVPTGMSEPVARRILRHEIGHVLRYRHAGRTGSWMADGDDVPMGDDSGGLP